MIKDCPETAGEELRTQLFSGLSALTASAFPKACPNCGRVYQTADAFIEDTREIGGRSGLKSSQDDDGSPLVELYRNCHCGSTLMDFFSDRRDESARGLRRRQLFSRLIELLISRGVSADEGRQALKKVMQGEQSPLLNELIRADSTLSEVSSYSADSC